MVSTHRHRGASYLITATLLSTSLLLAGCGGSQSSSGTSYVPPVNTGGSNTGGSNTGGSNTGGGGPPVTNTSGTRTLTLSQRASGDQAVAVSSFITSRSSDSVDYQLSTRSSDPRTGEPEPLLGEAIDLPDRLYCCTDVVDNIWSQRASQENAQLFGPDISTPLARIATPGEERTIQVAINSDLEVTVKNLLETDQTTHCNIWSEVVDGQPVVSNAKALQIAELWDTRYHHNENQGIYQTTRQLFGSEWTNNGGKDGDPKVQLVFLSSETMGGQGIYGYVANLDAYSTTTFSNSNEWDAIYLAANLSLEDTGSTLVHEFQHLINLNQKIIQQGTFPSSAQIELKGINEGLSVLGEELSGYSLANGNSFIYSQLRHYLNSTENYSVLDFSNSNPRYGSHFIFMLYLYNQFGDSWLQNFTLTPRVGVNNLRVTLPRSLDEVFNDFALSLELTNLNNAQAKHKIGTFKTRGSFPQGTLSGPASSPLNGSSNFSLSSGVVRYHHLPTDETSATWNYSKQGSYHSLFRKNGSNLEEVLSQKN